MFDDIAFLPDLWCCRQNSIWLNRDQSLVAHQFAILLSAKRQGQPLHICTI